MVPRSVVDQFAGPMGISSSNDGTISYATWLDDGKPWAAFSVEEIIFNADVSEYIRARGQ